MTYIQSEAAAIEACRVKHQKMTKAKDTPRWARQGQKQTDRSISFEQVYCNRKPEYIHAIVEHLDSGEWYILRCATHGLTFGRYPVKLAELHLRRSIHLTVPKGQSVFEAFGVRVLDCDEEKAQQNNDMAARAVLYDGYKPLLHLNYRERSREQNCQLGIENSPELESESED